MSDDFSLQVCVDVDQGYAFNELYVINIIKQVDFVFLKRILLLFQHLDYVNNL